VCVYVRDRERECVCVRERERVGVNFINILRTNFSYKRRFGSFYNLHVTRKKAAEMTFVQKICVFNVDEIDTRVQLQNSR